MLQDGLHEPQPQAVPYAAAVVDSELADRVDAIDEGIEYGLATAPATDQADVAYTHQGASTEFAEPQTGGAPAEAVSPAYDVEKASADSPKAAIVKQV